MKPGKTDKFEILIVFIGCSGITDSGAAGPAYANPVNDEAAQAWIAAKLKAHPTIDASDFIMVRGERVPLEIIPPEKTHRVIIGGESPATVKEAPHKPCAQGPDCIGGPGGRAGGNAHGRPGGRCGPCYAALPAGDPLRVKRPRKAAGLAMTGED